MDRHHGQLAGHAAAGGRGAWLSWAERCCGREWCSDPAASTDISQFSGHGMSRIFVCARAYAQTLRTGGGWDATLLPESFKLTEERLRRVREEQIAFEEKHAGSKVAVIDGQVLGLDEGVRGQDGRCCVM